MDRREGIPDLTRIPATIGSVIDDASDRLMKAGVDDPRLNAELLLATLLEVGRMQLTLRRSEQLTNWPEEKFRAWVSRRESREPLQYITGWTEFMGLRFQVDSSVLIPRPETELLVEAAVAILGRSSQASPAVLDVGTGSGNIALSVARFVPQAVVTALDISREALAVAARNAMDLGLSSVAMLHADIATFSPGTRFDMVVANPPYISLDEFSALAPEINRFEPRVATTDDDDGLRYVRLLIERAGELLKPGGTLLIELGFGQSEEARRLGASHGLIGVSVQKDLSGIPRLFSAVCPGGG